jgi:hypothetical protein
VEQDLFGGANRAADLATDDAPRDFDLALDNPPLADHEL